MNRNVPPGELLPYFLASLHVPSGTPHTFQLEVSGVNGSSYEPPQRIFPASTFNKESTA